MKKVYFLTLGCPKNTVDSENMAYMLQKRGYAIVFEAEEADLIVINTCSFIKDAKEESVDAILQAAALKKENENLKIVVCGCLAQRYAKELEREVPEADIIVGTGEFYDLADIIDSATKVHTADIDRSIVETGRLLSTPSHYAYIKLAEGCDKHCTYCIIPKIRGRQRSRKFEDIVSEATTLAEGGVKELILIAQDTGEYGTDLYGERALSKLLVELEKIEPIRWIRLLYVYPETIEDRLVEVMSKSNKILSYIDIPFQHCNDDVLKAMGRHTTKAEIVEVIHKLRAKMPEIAIRSTFITGFPGESSQAVEELGEFLKEMKLARVGIFTYSKEEGTPAAKMKGQIRQSEKQKRYDRLMAIQTEVSDSNLEKYLDRELEVLIEEETEDGVYIGRSRLDAPEIDGVVYVYSDTPLSVGSFYTVTVDDSMEHDLIAKYTA